MSELDDIEQVRTLIAPEWEYRLGPLGPDEDYSPEEACLAERVMVLGRLLRDKEGRRIGYRMPPVLALAIVRAFRADPMAYIDAIRSADREMG